MTRQSLGFSFPENGTSARVSFPTEIERQQIFEERTKPMDRAHSFRLVLLTAIAFQACLCSLGCSAETSSDSSAQKQSGSGQTIASNVRWVGVDSGYRSDGKK